MAKKTKKCLGCWDSFITFKNYDYCVNCAVNNNRYLTKSNCYECDGSGMIKFPGQKPRPCKLCYLTTMNKSKKLTAEEIREQSEIQFWKEVEKKSKSLIADLIERTLPISATPAVFDCERDADYRILLRDDLPSYYAEQDEYQTKITNQSWTEADVDYVSQDLVCIYLDLVVKSLIEWLSEYPAFENTDLAQKFTN